MRLLFDIETYIVCVIVGIVKPEKSINPSKAEEASEHDSKNGPDKEIRASTAPVTIIILLTKEK